jgi:hypothetical protein
MRTLIHPGSIARVHVTTVAENCCRGIPPQIGATLLQKDPEFRAIAGLPQEWPGRPDLQGPWRR